MPPPLRRLIRAVVGGAGAAVAAFFLAYALFFGVAAPVLFDHVLQSAKLLAVWQTLEPLPLLVTDPLLFVAGVAVLGAVHGAVFAGIAPGLPADPLRRGASFGALLWGTMALFFEFFAPLNLLGEPLSLVALELTLWAPVLVTEGVIISAAYGWGPHVEREA